MTAFRRSIGSRCPRVRASLIGAALTALLVAVSSNADGLVFTAPQLLPGDVSPGPAVGMQVEANIARGGDNFLAVWSDGRTTPDDYSPFATEASGTDVYGARLDANGNVIDSFVIYQDLGDQIEPQVAWDGTSWLVVWKRDTITLPTYERIEGVRVAPDGTVMDMTPIVIHDNETYYSNARVEGGTAGWVVLFQTNGPVDGLIAVHIAADGTVTNPSGLLVHSTTFLLDFDLAFAADEFLVAWSGSFDSPQGRRYSPTLQPIGSSITLPFVEKVESNGTDFLVVWASGSPPLATVKAVRVLHDGALPDPSFTIFTASGQAGTCCAGATWDGTHYWVSWGQLQLARVTADGQLLDPGGFVLPTPGAFPMTTPDFAGAATGGLQMVWNDGANGADYPKDVHTARIAADGQTAGETVLSNAAATQLEADVVEGDGTHLLVYLSRVSGSGRILAQRIDDTGTALDAEPIEVASGPIPGLGVPSLGAPAAAWDGFEFMITWSDGLAIFARRMLADGTFLDPAPLVVMDGFDPDVAAVGRVFLVVGLDFLSGNPQWQATHAMRVDGATGTNLDVESNALGGFAIFARYPHVVGWGDRWLAVWQRNSSHDNPAAGTTAAIVHADGTTPGLIDMDLGWRPDVAVADDVALVVAVTNTVASATTDLAGQILASDGSLPAPSFPISEAADKQLRPAVGWDGSAFIVAWEDKRNAVIYFDERTDIYGTKVDTDGTVLDLGGVPIAASTAPELQPALASLGGTTFMAASIFRPEAPFGSYRIGVQSELPVTGVGDTATPGIPGIRLLAARPNPARASLTIRFRNDGVDPVSLRVYDAGGRLVRTLVEERVYPASAAPIEVGWDGRDATGRSVGAGVFFYEVRTPVGAATEKVVLLQ